MDVAAAGLALAVAAPVMAVAAVAIAATTGRPILFRQRRPGRGARAFTLYKFRTMRGKAAPGREAIDDHLRLTRAGALLRRLSIDELPQLWNVLRGDMSLVGPRPLLTDYLPLYTPQQRRRHEVRPGI